MNKMKNYKLNFLMLKLSSIDYKNKSINIIKIFNN